MAIPISHSPVAATLGRSPAKLEVAGLHVSFDTPEGWLEVVRGVDLTCANDEILAIVGESGSGKSVTVHALTRLLPERTARLSGRIALDGVDLLALPAKAMHTIRGRDIAMIFQNPRASLNPSLTIGAQMAEVVRRHAVASTRPAALREAARLLESLSLREPEKLLARYPHQLSGGMCQRVAIAMALASRPGLLIADEPTTALDALVQASLLALFRAIHVRERIPMVLVTHDFGVVRALATRVMVMYAGQCVEEGPVDSLLDSPVHPYTRALIASIPDNDDSPSKGIEGLPPDMRQPVIGCAFAPRCSYALPICRDVAPARVRTGPASSATCHLASSGLNPS